MTVNPNLSVYRVPFVVTLTGAAFVIAESPEDALAKAADADIGDYLNVEDDDATIDQDHGELVDFGPIAFSDDPATATQYPDFAVEDHPDYNPTDHDEPGDEAAEPPKEGEAVQASGRPEGLKS